MQVHSTLKSIACAAMLSLCAASAGATTVNFTFQDNKFTGTFSGSDGNGDSVLTLNELTSFAFRDYPQVTVGTLFDFGSYNIAANLWNHDASGWGRTNFAYFSWDGGNSSANMTNTPGLATTQVADVPEPLSPALLGLGLLGIWAARRRQQ
jgi:hypothetical protein